MTSQAKRFVCECGVEVVAITNRAIFSDPIQQQFSARLCTACYRAHEEEQAKKLPTEDV